MNCVYHPSDTLDSVKHSVVCKEGGKEDSVLATQNESVEQQHPLCTNYSWQRSCIYRCSWRVAWTISQVCASTLGGHWSCLSDRSITWYLCGCCLETLYKRYGWIQLAVYSPADEIITLPQALYWRPWMGSQICKSLVLESNSLGFKSWPYYSELPGVPSFLKMATTAACIYQANSKLFMSPNLLCTCDTALLFLVYKWQNQGAEELSYLFNATPLISVRSKALQWSDWSLDCDHDTHILWEGCQETSIRWRRNYCYYWVSLKN